MQKHTKKQELNDVS